MAPRSLAGGLPAVSAFRVRGVADRAPVSSPGRRDSRMDSVPCIGSIPPMAAAAAGIGCSGISRPVSCPMAGYTGRLGERNLAVRPGTSARGRSPVGSPGRIGHAVAISGACRRIGPGGMRGDFRVRVAVGTVQRSVRGSRVLRDIEFPYFPAVADDQAEAVAEKASLFVSRQDLAGMEDRRKQQEENRHQEAIPHRNARPR